MDAGVAPHTTRALFILTWGRGGYTAHHSGPTFHILEGEANTPHINDIFTLASSDFTHIHLIKLSHLLFVKTV